MLENMWINVEFSSKLKKHIIKVWYDKDYWARPLKRAITDVITNKLSTMILNSNIKNWDNIKLDIDKDRSLKIEK